MKNISVATIVGLVLIILSGCQAATKKPAGSEENNQTELVEIWEFERSHILKWTLWSYDSEIDLSSISDQDENVIQQAFADFGEGEYRQWRNQKLGTFGFSAGSTYTNSEGEACRNYSISVEIDSNGSISRESRPAIACLQNSNKWEFKRSIF
ncbi:hypothetical protein [Spartinivicinus poritis]|uniref:Surface antigen domain-containing protein n=1 Tax=Spartinivicinus poritis TaxID=2994640 RepID=A0ABT5UB45_9GAMM|nr:hypothetical protein [Spartinivicinus sp. A2-2]MDE1463601.1 hypothetical protein [Spartinivicinus sp. A2-2]